MYKIVGSIMVILSSALIFSRKSFINYFTAEFLKHMSDIVRQIDYIKFKNLSYDVLFEEIDFDYKKELEKYNQNIFICKKEIEEVNKFFLNIGKRDREAENEYIKYTLKNLEDKQKYYFNAYTECRKINLLGGIAAGLFVVIFLI